MNTRLVTTGLVPLVIGSVEDFILSAFANGLPWNLIGGSATIYFLDPAGMLTSFGAAVNQTGASYVWTVIGPTGNWTRCWRVQDASGIIQYSRPFVFSVTTSP